MATGTAENKPTEDDIDFDPDFSITSNVVAVLEDKGRPPKVVEQLFTLRAHYHPKSSVLFRLFPVTDSASTRITHCLQIKAGDIKSLEKEVYGTANRQIPPPPWFGAVSSLLSGMKSVACLQFQLHSPSNVDLIKQADFSTENTPGEPVPDTWASLESLATASLFSLCFRHDLMTNKKFKKYQWAIGEYPNLAEERKKAYECMVDVRRLFHGAGVKVPVPGVDHAPPPTRECCSPPTPGTSSSYGSTLPFDVVPRGSPPPYNACPSEGSSPRAKSGAAAIFATSPRGDCDLPEYGEAERRDDVLDSSKGVLPDGNKDIDIPSTPKRKRLCTTKCTTQTSVKDVRRPEKSQRFVLGNSADESQIWSLIELQSQQIRRQGQQIEELQKTIEGLQRWKKQHEGLLGDLEGTCFQLGERQDDVDDVIGSLSQDVDDLAGKHDELGDQLLDVSDEVRDCVDQIERTVEENIREAVQSSMVKEIEVIVEAEVSKVKRKLWEALRPI